MCACLCRWSWVSQTSGTLFADCELVRTLDLPSERPGACNHLVLLASRAPARSWPARRHARATGGHMLQVPEILSTLDDNDRRIEAFVALGGDVLGRAYGPGKWTAAQILAHVADSN